VLPAAAQKTTVMPRTTVAPRPTLPVAPPVKRSKAPIWVGLAVLAVAVAAVLGVALSQKQDATPSQIGTVNQDTPASVKDPLDKLVGQVNRP
jgi:hypothetical protein